MSLPRPFHLERARIADAEGPGPMNGVTTATDGHNRWYRSADEHECDFLRRVAQQARRRGLSTIAIEGLLRVGEGQR